MKKKSNSLERACINLEVQSSLKNQVCQCWASCPCCNNQPKARSSCSHGPGPHCSVRCSLPHSLVPWGQVPIIIYHLQLPCCFSHFKKMSWMEPHLYQKQKPKKVTYGPRHPLPLGTVPEDRSAFKLSPATPIALHLGFLISLGFKIGVKFLCLPPTSLLLAKTNTE